jgi:hypothetical protein
MIGGTSPIIQLRLRVHDISKTIDRNLDALDCSSVSVISETVTISESVLTHIPTLPKVIMDSTNKEPDK